MTAVGQVPKHVADNLARRLAARVGGRCVYGCRGDARLYPGGRFCDGHAPGVAPAPDPARTVSGLRHRAERDAADD